jgi:hypothetical protein
MIDVGCDRVPGTMKEWIDKETTESEPCDLYPTVAAYRLTLILLMWRIGRAPNSIPIYIQQDAKLHSLFISGNCSTFFGWYFTHHQERIQQYLQYLVFVTPLLLSAAIVEELEPV